MGRERERDILVPHGPNDPSKFVGDRNGGFVVATASAEGDGPLVQARQRLGVAPATVRGHQYGTGAMCE